ncbi:LmeA family phospholipid-binding protein [Phytomonospora endophytica]|uniref:Uncharacterized protein YpmS n=1 Tax=Phytomonospora endophytica TaxID=714109 RepID=A0A841FS73_9ACTN|nr:DUF2993 domain-containing protein [Phytomonospora endophytica]MBB6038896.1 uncharacterized protein YpmS [Phytomonospora endophytica]GIG71560.1 hypothetical protein Pen01_78550 [Phytomonospora endophytica]
MPKPWWKRKGLRVTLIIVIVLGGLLVIADRVAASVAEDKVATLISQEAGNQGVTMTTEPDVDMGGWPFVTQVFGGEYEQIDIYFRDITAQGVNLPELNVHASNVTAAMTDVLNGAGPVVAQSMTADARLTYDSISDTLAQTDAKVEVSADGDQLLVKSTIDVFGTQIPVTGAATIEMGENAVKVTVTQMTADGVQVPPGGEGLIQEFASGLSKEIPLPPLPYNLQLSDVKVEPDAVVLSASANEVPLV